MLAKDAMTKDFDKDYTLVHITGSTVEKKSPFRTKNIMTESESGFRVKKGISRMKKKFELIT